MLRSLSFIRITRFSSVRCFSAVRPDVVREIPAQVEVDGVCYQTDDWYNLTRPIHRLLERKILTDPQNPLSLLKQRIVDHFHRNHRRANHRTPVFAVCDSENRVVSTFDNFDSLLIPEDHVSRRPADTYYVNKDTCLRAHTSAHQFSLIRKGLDAFLAVGDVYRRDEIDRTHYPCFHQMEGVRLFSQDELFGRHIKSDSQVFENGEQTPEKQAGHSRDTALALQVHLKQSLEALARELFGQEAEMRWVDAYFPFTHPSFELEVIFDGKWVEVLGCGVMQQDLLRNAGAGDKVGWAFGLGLERLAMILYGIPDIRLFWTTDSGFTHQFAKLKPNDNIKYKPISSFPQAHRDISFFLAPGVEFHDMRSDSFDIIRDVGGDLVEQVDLIDEFENKKKGKKSQTFRIVYRSNDRIMTREEVNEIHKNVEETLVKLHGVQIR
uniref:Phenylalanine--tRNA ligase, mitochondrial n=1 Tax=Bursaphelenchus xylophilus TaxID=6326 RepID=A0A1I7SX87_BURXY